MLRYLILDITIKFSIISRLIFFSFEQVQMVLIIIGWGTILPIGVIIARYFKKFPMLSEEWYSFHIMFQSIGYIVGTIGWITGLCLGNTSKQYANKTQRILSIIVFTFITVQVSPNFSFPIT